MALAMLRLIVFFNEELLSFNTRFITQKCEIREYHHTFVYLSAVDYYYLLFKIKKKLYPQIKHKKVCVERM